MNKYNTAVFFKTISFSPIKRQMLGSPCDTPLLRSILYCPFFKFVLAIKLKLRGCRRGAN